MSRPGRLVLVCGTGTEVGKTWTACGLLRHWRGEGREVGAWKPAQSFDAADPADTTDAALLAGAAGCRPEDVCPPARWYPIAMAPPMAADALGRPEILLADLAAEITWPHPCEIGLLETAGGVRSPIAHDGDAVDLGRAVRPDSVVLVAHAALGVLNNVRLSVDALRSLGVPVHVFLNRHDESDDLCRRNRAWLAASDGIDAAISVDDLATRLLDR